MRMRKALYGLKRASHDWYHTLAELLKANGFRRTCTDPSVFIHSHGDDILSLSVHFDNMNIMCANFVKV